MGESFPCCKTECIFVSTLTVSKSNLISNSSFPLGACLIKLIMSSENRMAKILKMLVLSRFPRFLFVEGKERYIHTHTHIYIYNKFSGRLYFNFLWVPKQCRICYKRFPLKHYQGTRDVVFVTGFSLLCLISAVSVGGLLCCPAHRRSHEAPLARPCIMCLIFSSIS